MDLYRLSGDSKFISSLGYTLGNDEMLLVFIKAK